LKTFLKYIFRFVVAVLVLVNAVILLSGRTYIYKGIVYTYFRGNTGPGILDQDIFESKKIPAVQPREWALHKNYNKPTLSNEAPAEIPEEEVFNGTAKVTIIMDDEETEVELAQSGNSVLEAAMDAGVDAPFSCQGGVCATCRAKVTSGKVVMDSNMALTDEEVEEGFILTCQAHPASANVVVNYDEAYWSSSLFIHCQTSE